MDKPHKVFDQSNIKDKSEEKGENNAKKKLRNKKRKNLQKDETKSNKRDKIYEIVENGLHEQNGRANEVQETKKQKPKKKKSKKDKKAPAEQVYNEVEDNSEPGNGKLRKAHKKKNNHIKPEEENLLQKRDAVEDEIYQISSGDDDCSIGMKKWIMEYHQQRQGLNVLQEKIDDFITAHEAHEEQEKIEREARAAEGGWTVVSHHKGRKKTTDAETGVVVGSVTQAAVLDKMANKKVKGVGLDFYRFQKREARKNEIMLLQSKFEQDKKRIQQLRAARKFRPY